MVFPETPILDRKTVADDGDGLIYSKEDLGAWSLDFVISPLSTASQVQGGAPVNLGSAPCD